MTSLFIFPRFSLFSVIFLYLLHTFPYLSLSFVIFHYLLHIFPLSSLIYPILSLSSLILPLSSFYLFFISVIFPLSSLYLPFISLMFPYLPLSSSYLPISPLIFPYLPFSFLLFSFIFLSDFTDIVPHLSSPWPLITLSNPWKHLKWNILRYSNMCMCSLVACNPFNDHERAFLLCW